MLHVDLSAPEFSYDPDDPEGFRSGLFRFGPLLGARELGASLYELPPGQAVCPYHYEYAEEECLLVLEGRATVRHPEGEEQLGPWQAGWVSPRPQGAHNGGTDTPG